MSDLRTGNWFQTYSGKKFWPLDPRPEDVDIVDIGEALSKICRYGGHCRYHYSVAQHSVYVSLIVEKREPEHALWGLLHDAAEAYIGDMVRPLKETRTMQPFRDAEAGIMIAVAKKLGLEFPEPAVVTEIDRRICFSEAEVILHGGHKLWDTPADPIRWDEWPRSVDGSHPGDLEEIHASCGVGGDRLGKPFISLHPDQALNMFMNRFHILRRRREHYASKK